MEQRRKVIVVGGGAAGLMAAIFAAREGAQVTVLEAMERPGKKLLLTGNGRCNLTNLDADLPGAYHGSGRKVAASLTRAFDGHAVCRFFKELGLLTQEKNGYVYPYSAQSGSVLEVLLSEIRRLKVKLKLSEKIKAVSKTPQGWAVSTEGWTYEADALILACGSKCVPSTGSDGSGYVLAKSLGHKILKVAPALTPVTCRSDYLQNLAGVRCRARVSLCRGREQEIAADTGELQWTKYGVSGIVVFQLSRYISSAASPEGMFFKIDLLPEYEKEQLFHILSRRSATIGQEKVSVLLAGLLPEKLIPVILSETDRTHKKSRSITKYTCSELTDEQLWFLIDLMKTFTLPITGTKSFDTCQVCAGGVDCREVDPDTLESRLHPGLYFAGEMLDVDGPCGGYNLQWAWSSGYAAGRAAAHGKSN